MSCTSPFTVANRILAAPPWSASGFNLFSSVYSDKSFNKTFRVPAAKGKVIVVVKTAKSKDQSFEIVTEEKTVQEITVKKLR